MKGWFGELECEDPAIIEETAHANAASVRNKIIYNIVRHILCHTVLRQNSIC